MFVSSEIQKVVVRFLAASPCDFSPMRLMFHLHVSGGEMTPIQTKQLKAVFMVRDLDGDRARQDTKGFVTLPAETAAGKKIAVRFKDGELICGYRMSSDARAPGLLRHPRRSDHEQRARVRGERRRRRGEGRPRGRGTRLEVAAAAPRSEAGSARGLTSPARRPDRTTGNTNARQSAGVSLGEPVRQRAFFFAARALAFFFWAASLARLRLRRILKAVMGLLRIRVEARPHGARGREQ